MKKGEILVISWEEFFELSEQVLEKEIKVRCLNTEVVGRIRHLAMRDSTFQITIYKISVVGFGPEEPMWLLPSDRFFIALFDKNKSLVYKQRGAMGSFYINLILDESEIYGIQL